MAWPRARVSLLPRGVQNAAGYHRSLLSLGQQRPCLLDPKQELNLDKGSIDL